MINQPGSLLLGLTSTQGIDNVPSIPCIEFNANTNIKGGDIINGKDI